MNPILDRLNDKQKEAVLKTEGPLLILAGAGSGKTRVITNRIAYMIQEKGVDPGQILAITFTNKAASEMRERQEQMLGQALRGAWICTFHSCCVRILRMHADKLGYDSNFTIYDADDQKTVIKNICKKLDIDTKKFKEKWFLGQISSAKDELVSVDKFELNASGDYYLEKVAKVYREYQQELMRSNAFDFDDLIVKTVELFRQYPDVLDMYQERFRYISVDEYQDTNTAQFVFVSLLAKKYKNICVVGDDDQSIYKFRGANIGNILNFEKVFPNATVIRLEQNYRSTKTILDAANAVISHNVNRKAKTLWTDAEAGEKIRLFFVDNPYVEADRVIAVIRKYVHDGYPLNSCACLYRTNAQSRALEEAFIRANIPYKIVGGVNFYQRKEIKDVLAYLKTIDNGRDDVAVKRIINVPKRNIGASTINLVDAFAGERGISFYSALDTGLVEGVFGKAGEKLRPFRDLIESLRKSASEISLKELIEETLDKSGYLKDLQAEQTPESEARIENIEELINKASAYEDSFREPSSGAGTDGGSDITDSGSVEDVFVMVQESPSLSGFLEEVSLIADIDSWDGSEDYVSLITIHSAKGLEFDNVFLCGMEDGLFPSNFAICSEDESDLEEERRLAYVGITRAKKHLVLTASKTRMVRGETMVSALSRFVREIPPLILENDRDNVYLRERPQESSMGSHSKPKVVLGEKPFALQSADHKKQFEVKNQAGLDYGVGDRVSHIKFGEGVVIAIDEGGRDYEVTVDFEDFGIKKMFAAFARLEKL
ncbi:MAG: UvrD-helicase domain-containing protein [Parasporobacterium sp.]|nr:UvrD-helicase domain-containing protein [Parasporobacterium sp.]